MIMGGAVAIPPKKEGVCGAVVGREVFVTPHKLSQSDISW